MSLSAYSEYKPSDAAWLGDIPKHWSLEPLRGQFEELKDKNVGALDQNYLSLVAGRGVMPYAEKGEMGNKKPDDLEKCKLVKAGNFVINSMNFGIGAFGVSTHDGVCSPVYVVLEPSEPRSLRYLRWIFDNPGFREVAQSFGNGILAHRAAIGWDDLKLMKIGVPPIEEQEAIAAFLDRETAKIDALVAEQELLIALLKEKRQAVISHAVTKGLDPGAPMKDSGIEWLGDIPAHWELSRLKFVTKFITSGSRGWGDYYADEGPLFIRIGNLTRDSIQLDMTDEQRVAIPENTEGSRARLLPGDLLFSITAYLGSVAVVPPTIEEAYISQHVALCRLVADSPISEWLGHVALSIIGRTHFDLRAYGGTKVQLSLADVAEMPILIPPVEEQKSILAELAAQVATFRELEEQAQAAISLLQERRAALISAAVTGKIDVRGLVEQHEMEAA
ncbi:restriction endonuclease subunit S [Qipengyuania sp. GPGPB31]|uniref:restriction endonuclease subunit S n=1 Tax=Qipengyuania sp. GPGPB31 TaxID=3023518 RepID=UPI0031343B2C